MAVNIKLFVLLFVVFSLLYIGYLFALNVSKSESEEEIEASIYVKDIVKKENDALVPSSRPKMVLAHASWCGHCKQMMPSFMKAAEKVPEVDWIRVSEDAAKELAQRPDMKGYPTVYGVSLNGNIRQCTGRSEKNLIEFAKTL